MTYHKSDSNAVKTGMKVRILKFNNATTRIVNFFEFEKSTIRKRLKILSAFASIREQTPYATFFMQHFNAGVYGSPARLNEPQKAQIKGKENDEIFF